MKTSVQDYLAAISGKKIGFIGVGVSHRELIEQYTALGAEVTLRDKRNREQLGSATDELERIGVRLILGEDYLENITEEIVFRTPGMRYLVPQLTEARRRGVVVTSEMEMFFELCPCKIFGITGSDGKTTSTTLIGALLGKEGYTVHVGGNIGKALLPHIAQIKPTDMAVVELSSFQLISMRCSPDVALVTNLAPNHLDMHADMAEYIDAKRNLLLHQGPNSRAVLNADNEITAAMVADVRGELFEFSRKNHLENGAFLSPEGNLTFAKDGILTKICSKDEIKIPGMHNVENFLGVIAAVWGYVSPENIRRTAMDFAGVEHRLELVRVHRAVSYYNDSIASSPTRTIAGLLCFDTRIILIAGGYDKKIPFEPLADTVAERVKLLILTGPTAALIEKAVSASPFFDSKITKIIHAKDMQEAVKIAAEEGLIGDIVSLSPACASFDAYQNFEERGKHFKELVNALI